MGIEGLRISALCPGRPPVEMISGAECQSAFVNDSGSPLSLSPALVYATFIKINICRRRLGEGQGGAPSKRNRYTRELRTPEKSISCQRGEQTDRRAWGRVGGGAGHVSSNLVFSWLFLSFTILYLTLFSTRMHDSWGKGQLFTHLWIWISYPEWHVYHGARTLPLRSPLPHIRCPVIK